MKTWFVLFYFIAFAGFGLKAGAEPFEIDKAEIGMFREDFIRSSEARCKSRGMIYKYLICTEETTCEHVPMTVSYYFSDLYLTMIKLDFNQEHYHQVQTYLSKKYGNPTSQWKEQALSVMEWDSPEIHVELVAEESKRRASARIVSTFETRSFDLDKFQR